MERKQKEEKPQWEMVDPKPPVVQCGHLEKRKEYEKSVLQNAEVSASICQGDC